MTNGYVCNGIMMIARSEQTRNFIPHFRRYSPSFGFVPSTIRTPFWDCILFNALKKNQKLIDSHVKSIEEISIYYDYYVCVGHDRQQQQKKNCY